MKMMKNTLFVIAAMAAVACVKENINDNALTEVNPNLVETTLTAGTESEDTKAAFSETAYPQIVWQGNEEISVLGANTANQKFTTTSTGNKAEFTGLADLTDEVLYAVYPYDAAATLTDDGKISNITVPAVQTATAGSFDPKAYIAVAKSTDKNLTFKAVGGFVKFKLEDATNVKSVTMVGNNPSTNMACSATIAFNENGSISHGSPYVNGTASTSVKLEGTFETGKEYFMVVRPQPYTGGVTLYIEYTDGTVLSRKGTAALFESGKSRNYIRNLGTLKKADFTKVDGLFALYNMGYDISVGDMTINKTTHTATLITASEANTSVYNQFNNGGVYFLATSGEGTFNLHSNVAVKNDVVLIGNNPDTKVTIDMNGKNVNHTAKTIALKNLELDTDAYTNYVFANNNATADVDAFILDNCSVTGLIKPLWYVNVAGYTVKNVTMVNTDIALGANTNIIDLAKTTSTGNEKVAFRNCIIYGASNYVSRIVNNAQGLSEWNADVVFENNTVFNLHAGSSNGLLHMAGAKSVTFKNNLVSFYSLNATEYVIRIWKNSPTYTVDNNHFWARAAAGIPDDLTFYDTTMVEAATANILTSNNYPFTSTVSGAGATR